MKTAISINAEKRALDTKAKHLREEGFILGSLYGHGVKATPIKFEYQEFRKAYRRTGSSTVLNVKLDGKEFSTLVHELQYDPLSDKYIHIDFLVVNDNEPIKAKIPLILEGLSPAVKNLSSVLITPINFIEIECLPKHLIKEIIVNIEGLEKFHDVINVSDLEVSSNKNITVITPGNMPVVVANTPKGGITDDEEEESTSEEKTEETKSE